MTATSDWIKKDYIEFKNKTFGDIDLTICQAVGNTNEEVMYFITLSSTSPPEEDNYDQLYIERSEIE